LEATLSLGLACHTLDVGRTGQAVTDTGADGAAGQCDSATDECAGELNSAIAYCH
jgi:hypothetical protein